MMLVSAYAPTSFLLPVLVWTTCDCNKSEPGNAHITGWWIEALNGGHALQQFYTSKDQRTVACSDDFIIADLPAAQAIDLHVEMAQTMQNGLGDEVWSSGYPGYLLLLKKHGPRYLEAAIALPAN